MCWFMVDLLNLFVLSLVGFVLISCCVVCFDLGAGLLCVLLLMSILFDRLFLFWCFELLFNFVIVLCILWFGYVVFVSFLGWFNNCLDCVLWLLICLLFIATCFIWFCLFLIGCSRWWFWFCGVSFVVLLWLWFCL